MAARTAVVAGTATAVVGGMHRRQADKAAQQQAAAQPAPAEAAPEPEQADGQDDAIAKIQELGKLKTQGLLTDEEFAAAKAKILATM
jgi:hypothetical protein